MTHTPHLQGHFGDHFIVVGFYSCEKEFATVTASGIVDTTTVNFKNTYSKFIIRSKTLKLNPIQSNNLPVGLIGKFNNPEFGSYNAEFVTQLRPSQFNPIFAENLENLTIDKVHSYRYHTFQMK